MISEHHSTRLDEGRWPVGALRLLISAPFIYAVLIPVIFLDLVITIYQFVCFPLYGLTKVKRREYVQFERGKMEDLQLLDRINCHYCSYVNGVMGYARKVAAETERMWCPIRHKPQGKFVAPAHHDRFVIRSKRPELATYYKEYEKDLEKHPCEDCDCGEEKVRRANAR